MQELNVFTTFRQRLLFWFFVLISFNLVLIFLTSRYIKQRESILQTTNLIESSYTLFLKDTKAQLEFFSHEPTNPAFFFTGQSKYTARHEQLLDSIQNLVTRLADERLFDKFDTNNYYALNQKLLQTDSLFNSLVSLLKQRGYKDFNLEGTMRTSAHKLENSQSLSTTEVLTLRRHEKDYIIRNEEVYVTKLNDFANQLIEKFAANKKSMIDSTAIHLTDYLSSFNQLVALDKQIGVRDNSGLKGKLDEVQTTLEQQLISIVNKARETKNELLSQLSYLYAALVVALILISLTVSYFIARLITKPLTELTEYITRFVESQFTFEGGNPVVRSKDEIGKLTQNFTVLKKEIINQLKFFKQKVDERTAELAHANDKLISINEANSRFVPNEFLQFLNRKSIEEVMLGDHIEQTMTVMFTDIREFTRISESLNPQENFDFINAYLNEIAPHVKEHGGFIDKFIGDSVMALFPASADNAIKAGIAIAASVDRFNKMFIQKNKEPIKIGIGIHYGQLILGTIGFEHRLETTVISDAVNIASRLEGLTKHYGTSIIISDNFLNQLKEKEAYTFRFLEHVKVRGKSKSVTVYEVVLPWEVKKLRSISRFNDALTNMKTKNFDKANNTLNILLVENNSDEVVKVFLKRCEHYRDNGVPEGWDGTETMKIK